MSKYDAGAPRHTLKCDACGKPMEGLETLVSRVMHLMFSHHSYPDEDGKRLDVNWEDVCEECAIELRELLFDWRVARHKKRRGE